MSRQFLYTLLLVSLAGSKASAQRVSPPLWRADPALPLVSARPATLDLTSPNLSTPNTLAPTYWKEGGIVGAIVVGLAGAVVAGGLCGNSETNQGGCSGTTAGALVVGGLTGFALGALIGGQFHKRP